MTYYSMCQVCQWIQKGQSQQQKQDRKIMILWLSKFCYILIPFAEWKIVLNT